MNPYYLICVGGSGLWTYLHLLLRHVSQLEGGTPSAQCIRLPAAVVVIDQATADVDAIQAAAAEVLPIGAPAIFRVRMGDAPSSGGGPALQLSATVAVQSTPQPSPSSQIIHGMLEWTSELQRPTREGFYGQPRLTAAWAELFGFEPLGAIEGGPSWLAALRAHRAALAGGMDNIIATSREARESIRSAGADQPAMVVVGSVTGGTGAGLLPSLARELSGVESSVQGEFAYDFHTIALLPWFAMPPGFGGPHPDRLRANAARGAEALVNIAKRFYNRFGTNAGPHGKVRTTCSFVGTPLNSLAVQPSLAAERDASIALQRRFVAPVFDVAVDLLVHHVTKPAAVATLEPEGRVVFVKSGYAGPERQREAHLVAQGEARLVTQGEAHLVTQGALARVLAAQRAQALSDARRFPLRDAAMIFGVPAGVMVQRVGGLGLAMSRIVLGAVQGGGRRAAIFLDHFTASLQRIAKETFDTYGRLPSQGPWSDASLSAVLEDRRILADLDEALVLRKAEVPLFRLADTGAGASLSEPDVRTKAAQTAEYLWKLLLGVTERTTASTLTSAPPQDLQDWSPVPLPSIKPAAMARGSVSTSTVELTMADGHQTDALDKWLVAVRNSYVAANPYDTMGWAEVLGHYYAVRADLAQGTNLSLLNNTSWAPFVNATRRLYLGLLTGHLETLALTDEELRICRAEQGFFSASAPSKIVVANQPQWTVGLVLRQLGAVPCPRFVTGETEALTQHVGAIPAMATAQQKSILAWYGAGLTQVNELAGGVMTLLFGSPDNNASQLQDALPFATFALQGEHLFPRMHSPEDVQVVSRLSAVVPNARNASPRSFELRYNRVTVLRAVDSTLRAVAMGVAVQPQPGPNRPLVSTYFNV